MIEKQKKKPGLKARILTVILGIIGIGYWIINRVENIIEIFYKK